MKNEVDLLKKIEDLTARMNQMFKDRGHDVFSRYPLLFALLILFGVTMVTQGIKDVLLAIPLFNNSPFVMLIMGLLVLLITGTLYKKLKK